MTCMGGPGGEAPCSWAILAIFFFWKKQPFLRHLDDILNVFTAIKKYAKLLRYGKVLKNLLLFSPFSPAYLPVKTKTRLNAERSRI